MSMSSTIANTNTNNNIITTNSIAVVYDYKL